MNQSDVKWLKQVKKYPNRFKIVIDNDQVWVEDYIEGKVVHDFEEYGYHLLHDILNQLGYKSEFC